MSELPKEFTFWLVNVISKAENLINRGLKKRERRSKIIYEIVFVCIKAIGFWLKIKDAGTTLINLAEISGGNLLPTELENFREHYHALKILKKDLDEKTYFNIKKKLDNDFLSAPESKDYIKEMNERIVNLHKRVKKKKVDTGGHPKYPLRDIILFKCDSAFDHKCSQIVCERIALFINAIFSDETFDVKKANDSVRHAIEYIIDNAEGETIEEKHSYLEKEWDNLRKQSMITLSLSQYRK